MFISPEDRTAAPDPQVTTPSPAPAVPPPRVLSRRQAIPLMGLAVLAISGCELQDDPLAPAPKVPDDWLAKARVYRGGMQRFALQQKTDGVAVRVESSDDGESLTVTVYQTDPKTGRFVPGAGGPNVLEVYEGVTLASISQIESRYLVFYYLGAT